MARRTWQQLLLGPVREADTQAAVEKYLKLNRRKFFRVPDIMMLAVSKKCNYLPTHWKAQISEYIKDWPDLLIPRSVPWMPYPLLLGLELKAPSGKFTDGQIEMAPHIRMRSAWTFESAITEVDSFFAWTPSKAVLDALGEFSTPPLAKIKKVPKKTLIA